METFYKCSQCGTIYRTPEDAELCEKLDKFCDCKVYGEYTIFDNGTVSCTLNYNDQKIIIKTKESTVSEYPMNNCPLCGRPLNVNRRAVHGMIL